MKPYTYIIESKIDGRKYYGVKFAKDANPSTLWKNYFTSSKIIKDLIKKYGKDSFIARVDKVFETAEDAINYECKFLQEIKNKDEWLNQNFGSGYDVKCVLYKTESHKRKISEGNKKPKSGKALEACIRNAKLGMEARRGQKDSPETRRKRAESLSKALTGVPQPQRRKIVLIDNKEYIGVASVTKEYGITRQTVYNRIKSKDWNWHYGK